MGQPDRQTISTLEGLWSTPVGRRWVLKAGLGSLVAGLVGSQGWAMPGAAGQAAPVAKAAPVGTGALATVTLQFALDELEGVSGLVLVANGQRVVLRPHTGASRAALRARGGLWQAANLSALSHYVQGVRLPPHRASALWVEGRRGKQNVVVSEIWHTPEQATLALAEASHRLTGTLVHVSGNTQRLQALGVDRADLRSAMAVAQLDTVGDSYQTASALTMTHPNVATVDPDATATTKALLAETAEVTTLGTYIAQMQRAGRDFATLEEAVGPDGAPAEIEVGDLRTTFSTIFLNSTDAKFQRNTKAAVAAGIGAVRDDADLGAVIDKPLEEDPAASAKTWAQPQGMVAQPVRYGEHLSAQAGVEAKLKNPGFLFGTQTVLRGGYSGGKVPVRLYNNFVRWGWAYVQYLGADGTNLSIDPNASFPDTKYSKSVAVVPQVFTIFGIPVWGSNTVDFTLEFPEGAHTARLLYCGLGSDLLSGGWRQYFPSDAYPDRIAPTDEVWVAALITGIMTIGLNAFCLAVDINVARVWTDIRKYFEYFDKEVNFAATFSAVVNATGKFTVAESAAVTFVTGGATYVDIAHKGENLTNLWNLLLQLSSVIPKLLFNPRNFFAGEGPSIWTKVGQAIVATFGVDKATSGIPFIGQVLAITAAVGDAITLAEVAVETAISPWVIENEVSLTYPVTVTIARDPRSSSFPATARSWRLEALVDGVVGLPPVVGDVNQRGHLQSEALVRQVTAPFGGQTIQWSVVFLDEDGAQVGGAASAQYPNNDPAHPASAVSLEIEQLPATITGRTVFKRAATTTYSPQAGGYSWSDQVAVTATARSAGAEDVTGAAVATLAGVAGMVWKENDRFYLRGVPLAQDRSTVKFGTGTREGWARRPFLLLDPFVEAQDQGNHVLLEPDEASAAYHVRPVTLDPQSGAISWDPSASLGTFMLAVSAAALHSSGLVVAVNTDTGRLGVLEPAATPRPQLATYAAGTGDQPGLLRSPLAVAITNPGVVLVLEAASSQLSAFDLNLDPARYFGPSGGEFTLDLVSPGTYLDLAVDGAAQIYTLYFTGTGANPGDYHIDVYSESGEPIATHSPGTNIPQLAVDYWRSIYAPNYSPLTNLGTTTAHIDPRLGVLEPSLSRFDPTQRK